MLYHCVLEKAEDAILVTEFGIFIEEISEPLKAFFPMLVTEFGITVFLHPTINVLEFVSIIALQLFLLSYFLLPFSTVILVSLAHEKNALSPTLVTDPGIVIEVRLEQP